MTAEPAINRGRGGQPGENNGQWKGGPQAGTCHHCGAVFYAPRWELKKRKYCSRSCYAASNIDPLFRRTRPHVLLVEKMLGRRLPSNAVVHHINRNRKDNRNSNLVVCQDQAYHMIIHQRMRVLGAAGNPNTDKICSRCRVVKPRSDFHKRTGGDGFRCYCKECQHLIYLKGRKTNGICA